MNTADGLALGARVVGGLVIVLVLVAISARIARRSRHFGNGSDLQIIDRLGISRDAQLAVIRAGDRHLLIGIGPQGITMLSHLDDATMAFEPGAALETLTEAADDVPAVSPGTATPVPPVTSAPVTIADLPEEIAAELVAQFEAAAQAEQVAAEIAREEAIRAELIRTEAAWAEPPVGASVEQPLRRHRRRHAVPESEPQAAAQAADQSADQPVAEVPEVQLPGAVNLGDYPDLASALRAAGRTTHPVAPTTGDEPAVTGGSSWIPTQRSDSETPDLSQATSSAPVAPSAASTEAGTDAAATGDNDRRRGRNRRVPQQRTQQANGSVLSPATWRQGIEALREMTVRRG